MQTTLRIHVRDEAALGAISRRLAQKGEGEVVLVLALEDERTEVEFRLPGRYLVSPQLAGALKTIPGVVDVQAA